MCPRRTEAGTPRHRVHAELLLNRRVSEVLEPNVLDVAGMGGAVASGTGVVRRVGVSSRTVAAHRRPGSQGLKPGGSL